MWNLSLFREVNFFHRKMLTLPALQNMMKFQHFFKNHQISSNLQDILESSSETCMWNLSLFREVKFFHRKRLTVACEISVNSEKLTYFIEKSPQCRPYKYHEISTFIQNSPNFIKLAEHIGIIIRNMHVKFEPIQRSQLIS